MKRLSLLLLTLLPTLLFAKIGGYNYNFYGFVRGDMYYDTHDYASVLEGSFFLYPADSNLDDAGNDLSERITGTFGSFSSRLGIDVVSDKELFGAKTSAKIEADFAYYNSASLFRLRQAYVNLDWEKSSLLMGQTWHPLFGDVSPSVLALSTGAPFQPFNRSTMVRHNYRIGSFKTTAAAIYQLMSLSTGPIGKSSSYLKNSAIPEIYLGVDWKEGGVIAGAGVEMLSLMPLTQYTYEATGKTYRIDDRITTFSAEAHAKYSIDKFTLAAKTIWGNNLTHTSQLGGYAVATIDQTNGAHTYTPFTVSSNWVNATYGKLYQIGVFAGYAKNLGTSEAIYSSDMIYGTGNDIDQLLNGIVSFSYNPANWKSGIELNLSRAYYGDLQLSDGTVTNTHAVDNLRISALFVYNF